MNYDDRITAKNEKNIKDSVYNLIEEVTESAECHAIGADMHDDVTAHCMLFLTAAAIQISETLIKILDAVDAK